MPLEHFSCRDFRCLRAVEFSADPDFSLIYGANGSGKTSLLEAIAYLGRGRSFRYAATESLVRHGQGQFLLQGTVRRDGNRHQVGVRNGRAGLELSIDGERGGGAAALAAVLPLQVIDPDVHNLVAGGPEQRRRFLDWVGFHVERGFLERWRRYRRVLRQRNAALKSGGQGLAEWDRELVAAGRALDEVRERVVESLLPPLATVTEGLLDDAAGFAYGRGWSAELELEEALARSLPRDQETGTTSCGPHRADLRLKLKQRMARKLVSRGQQKLLACAMIVAATRRVQQRLGQRLLLLLDDPAAELDRESLERLMAAVRALECQVVATALHPESTAFPAARALFHVERGALRALS